jgi:hypothetical protein
VLSLADSHVEGVLEPSMTVMPACKVVPRVEVGVVGQVVAIDRHPPSLGRDGGHLDEVPEG